MAVSSALTSFTSGNASDLVASLTPSAGFNLQSASLLGGSATSYTPSIAFYDGSIDSLGLGAGFVMTTGSALIQNTNTSSGFSHQLGNAGYAPMQSVVEQTYGTAIPIYDTSVLELTFDVETEYAYGLRLDLVLASEEYPEFTQGQYSDLAALVMNGTNYGYFNQAGYPNKDQPLSIATASKYPELFINNNQQTSATPETSTDTDSDSSTETPNTTETEDTPDNTGDSGNTSGTGSLLGPGGWGSILGGGNTNTTDNSGTGGGSLIGGGTGSGSIGGGGVIVDDGSSDSSPIPIEYDGISQVLSLYLPIKAGTNQLQIGITDVGDALFDSALFVSNLRVLAWEKDPTDTGEDTTNEETPSASQTVSAQSVQSFLMTHLAQSAGVVQALAGDAQDNQILGTSTNNHIDAGAGKDEIRPLSGYNQVLAGAGDDLIYSGEGHNSIYAGAGWDTVRYNQDLSQIKLSYQGNQGWQIQHAQGTDALLGVEAIQFTEQSLQLNPLTVTTSSALLSTGQADVWQINQAPELAILNAGLGADTYQFGQGAQGYLNISDLFSSNHIQFDASLAITDHQVFDNRLTLNFDSGLTLAIEHADHQSYAYAGVQDLQLSELLALVGA